MSYAVLTLSDRASKGVYEDLSGKLLMELIKEKFKVKELSYSLLPDNKEMIEKELIRLCDEVKAELIITTGGTGLAKRDITPDATRAVIDRELDGMAEAIRAGGMKNTPFAMLSRGTCGIRGNSLIINFSGSQKAVKEQFEIVEKVLEHALKIIKTGNC